MKIYISHAGNYDYQSELYAPIKQSALFAKHDIFLPHEPGNMDVRTKDIIQDYDLLIAEVSRPSTGQGIEIGLANAAHIPVVAFYKKDAHVSSSLQFYCLAMQEYADTAELLEALAAYIAMNEQ